MTRQSGSETAGLPAIAILGTGKMGSAIAERLAAAGFELTLWNRTRARAEALGIGRVVDTPMAAVGDATIVISSLTGPEAVRTAYLGPDGALAAAQGKLVIEMSTAGPDIPAELAAKVATAGGRFVDAPIVGAPTAVRDGKAAILVGGDRADVAAASSVLGSLGTVRHVGPLGSGARLKLVANSMLANVMLAAAELQVAGEEAGLGGDDVFWLLQRIVPGLEVRRDGFLAHRHSPALFAVRDLLKDLDLASALYDAEGARTPLTDLSRTLVADVAWETPDLDISAVIRPYRKAASYGWAGSSPTKGASNSSKGVPVA